MPKDTGKKLADMLYGQNPEQAAFGVYPQMKGRRSKQDPEAAKNVPIDLLRGAVSGVLGAPGDIESLIRLLPGLDERTILPTSEDIEGRLPFKSDTPVSRAATTVGQLGGGFYTGPGSPLRLAGAVPGAVKRAGQDFAMAAAQSGPNVIKPKGGNFLTNHVEQSLVGIKPRVRTEGINGHTAEDVKSDTALKKWVEGNLTNYMKRDMGTPEDPLRKLAEQGITHNQNAVGRAARNLDNDTNLANEVRRFRSEAGFPEEGMGQSEMAKGWEALADQAIYPYRAGDIQQAMNVEPRIKETADIAKVELEKLDKDFEAWLRSRPDLDDKDIAALMKMRFDDKANLIGNTTAIPALEAARNAELARSSNHGLIAKANPWISKLDPEEKVYSGAAYDLGFDHIIDVLREDLTTGRIRPEQLNKVSMEQAVRRTYEYDQELAAKMAQARAAQREGLPVYKEYPEGYRWIELNRPGAFASESEAMGHSVRGYEPPQGHPDWIEGSGDRGSLGYGHGGWEGIKSGKAKVYSLVDPKGNPHVTVEVGPPQARSDYDSMQAIYDQAHQEANAANFNNTAEFNNFYHDRVKQLQMEMLDKRSAEMAPRITQIKGKQNRAPGDEYLPFVQDFVRSGKWSDVGDLHNTGMRATRDIFSDAELQKLRDLGHTDLPHIMPGEEIQRYHNMIVPEGQRLKYDAKGNIIGLEGAEGMAHGGSVHISDNPDVMQMELAGGGLVSKLAKLARAPAKTKQEIEAIAERIAPQVTGEYVRSKPGSAITVAGKTKKQFEREKSLPVDIRATAAERVPEPVDIEKLKGEVMIGIPGDPTVTGKTLHGVGDVRLESPAPQHGGPLYGLYHDDDHFWASGLGAARRVQNLAKEAGEQYDAPVVGKYVMMGPESINYAQHFADANLQAIDLSKMTKKQVEQFNKLIRQGSPASGPRPSFPGIEDKESAYLQMAMDPELRKHFNQLMQQNTVTEALNLPSGQDIRFAITEPPLRDLETGVTGFSMGRMRPDIPAAELKLSEHPTYSHDIPGHFMGQTAYPVPYELSFPDTLKAIRENPKQAPHEFGSLKMVGPRQTIDQQLIDELKMYEERMKALTGKADGGEVHGLSSQDMLFLQSQDDLAKLPPQAQREYITNMGGQELRQRMAPKYADGGEITADDLILEERKL